RAASGSLQGEPDAHAELRAVGAEEADLAAELEVAGEDPEADGAVAAQGVSAEEDPRAAQALEIGPTKPEAEEDVEGDASGRGRGGEQTAEPAADGDDPPQRGVHPELQEEEAGAAVEQVIASQAQRNVRRGVRGERNHCGRGGYHQQSAHSNPPASSLPRSRRVAISPAEVGSAGCPSTAPVVPLCPPCSCLRSLSSRSRRPLVRLRSPACSGPSRVRPTARPDGARSSTSCGAGATSQGWRRSWSI